MSFISVSILLIMLMCLMWALRPVFSNDGLVDLTWPTSFGILALYFLFRSDPITERGLAIAIMYGTCSLRFVLGWTERTLRHGEDARWFLWREKWQCGDGLFGVRSVATNFFFFYQIQQFANVTLISLPLYLNTVRDKPIGLLGWASIAMWLVSILLESWADYQLWRFKQDPSHRGMVCQVGLWRYSRHPNYFFELLIWVSYALFSIEVADQAWEYVGLFALLPMGYWFLFYFTGVPMTERQSIKSRGQAYRDYMAETSQFFPWFPKKKAS